MSLIAHGGAFVVGLEFAGALALVAAARTVRTRRRRMAAIAGGLALFVSAAPPLHAAADTSVTAHMVQHLILTLMVAPLAAITFAGSSLRRTVTVRRLSSSLVVPRWSPAVAAVAASAVMVTWHVPAAYDAAVDQWWLHGAQHLTLLATSAWLWAAGLHHGTGRNPIGVVVAFGAAATAGSAVGVLLMFAPIELYASQNDLGDGQIAGSLLAGSGVLHAAAVFVLATRWLDRLRRRSTWPPSEAAVRWFGVVVAVGLAAVAPHMRSEPAHGTAPVAAAERGAEIYRRDCASCHGPRGEGTARGITLADRGTSSVYYSVATGRMPIDDADDPIERDDPAYSPDQIDDLVAYTSSFVSGPAVPPLLEEPDRAEGGELYRLHCGACHGAAGIGGAQAFGRVAPSVLEASERETAAAVVAGPGGMPSFRAALDDGEVSSVADYVAYLQDPVRRGISLQGGRVGEGLIAWLIGVGLLLACSRWVASRSS